MTMVQRILVIVGNLLFITHCVFSRSYSYGRRAQADCYIPRGEQYARSIYSRAYGIDLGSLPQGYRISLGKRIAITCKKDIQADAILKSTSSRCVYGKWRPPLPNCIEHKRCGNAPMVPKAIASETWSSGKTYPHGYVVSYVCLPDYFQAESSEIECQNGLWTEPRVVCEEPVQQDLCRGKFVMNADITEITVTQYKVTCLNGYELEDEQEIFECNAGHWVTRTPVCQPVKCSNIYMHYDVLSGGNELTHGVSIRIRCAYGQTPFRGLNEYHCKNGKWKPFMPRCKRYCNIRKKYYKYSHFTHIQTYQNVNGNVQHGQKIRQKCHGETRSRTLRCMNGRWRPRPKKCPPVEGVINEESRSIYRNDWETRNGCPLITGNNFEFKSLDESVLYDRDDDIQHDTTVQQICKDGENYGKIHIVHCYNGTWSPELRACPNSECSLTFKSQEVRNGTIEVSNADTDLRNSICTYKFELEDYERVKVTFVAFNISGDPSNCSTSYVSYKSTQMEEDSARFCGETLPAIFKMSGPDAMMTLNTLRAEVATFEAHFEIISAELAEPKIDISEIRRCPTPNHSDIVYTPLQDQYYVNDTIQAVRCRDEFSYLHGPESLVCQEDATWSSLHECVKPNGCSLKEKPGVLYQVGNSVVNMGDIDHGSYVIVTQQCDGAPTDIDNLNTYQTLLCDNGTLSGEVFGCPDDNSENESEDHKCSHPRIYGVSVLPEKESYIFNDTVYITGCLDISLAPIGSQKLVCMENGDWFGSASCQSYCGNGIKYIRATKFSYFRRGTGVQYHQMLNIYDSIACYTECETFQGFTCLSFEYRTDISVCTLVNERPNKENFIQIPNMDKIKVYERACADRCQVPDPIPRDLSFRDEAWKRLVARQAVLSGTTIRAVCKTSFKTDHMTCMGGKWNKVFDDNFC